MVGSPCIKICKLNKEKICIGCFRTIEEISNWKNMTDNEKKNIIENLVNKYPSDI